MRPTPFRPAYTVTEADDRTARWHRGEYDATASLQEVLGYTDAEMVEWKRFRAVPPDRCGALPQRGAA